MNAEQVATQGLPRPETGKKKRAPRRKKPRQKPQEFAIAGLPRIATIEVTAQVFANTGKTPPAIRADIFKAADRLNSRGEKIAGNGLGSSGAIIRRGRKILIDLDRYGAWLAGRAA